jgi:serine phosphatase RsbU (regulator of sigma subunit)
MIQRHIALLGLLLCAGYLEADTKNPSTTLFDDLNRDQVALWSRHLSQLGIHHEVQLGKINILQPNVSVLKTHVEDFSWIPEEADPAKNRALLFDRWRTLEEDLAHRGYQACSHLLEGRNFHLIVQIPDPPDFSTPAEKTPSLPETPNFDQLSILLLIETTQDDSLSFPLPASLQNALSNILASAIGFQKDRGGSLCIFPIFSRQTMEKRQQKLRDFISIIGSIIGVGVLLGLVAFTTVQVKKHSWKGVFQRIWGRIRSMLAHPVKLFFQAMGLLFFCGICFGIWKGIENKRENFIEWNSLNYDQSRILQDLLQEAPIGYSTDCTSSGNPTENHCLRIEARYYPFSTLDSITPSTREWKGRYWESLIHNHFDSVFTPKKVRISTELSEPFWGETRYNIAVATEDSLEDQVLSQEHLGKLLLEMGFAPEKEDQLTILSFGSEYTDQETALTVESKANKRKEFWTDIAISVAKMLGIMAALITLRFLIQITQRKKEEEKTTRFARWRERQRIRYWNNSRAAIYIQKKKGKVRTWKSFIFLRSFSHWVNETTRPSRDLLWKYLSIFLRGIAIFYTIFTIPILIWVFSRIILEVDPQTVLHVNPRVIDGYLADWPEASQFRFSRGHSGEDGSESSFSHYILAGYNLEENALYVATAVWDDAYVHSSESDHGDGCSLLVRIPASKHPQIHCLYEDGKLNTWVDRQLSSDLHRAVEVASLREGNWTTYEWKLDFNLLFPPVRLVPGFQFGLDVINYDRDADRKFSWYPWARESLPGGNRALEWFQGSDRRTPVRCLGGKPEEGIADLHLNKHNHSPIPLHELEWKFWPGDHAQGSHVSLDDSDWGQIPLTSYQDTWEERGWSGIGWFRLTVDVDSTMRIEPVAIQVDQSGASEIYIDGVLTHSIGQVGNTFETQVAQYERKPLMLSFGSGGKHLLAVRHSSFRKNESDFQSYKFTLFPDTAKSLEQLVNQVRESIPVQIFIGLGLAFALLHFLLFAFYRKARGNLYYALFISFATISALLFLSQDFLDGPNQKNLMGMILILSITLTVGLGLMFLYALFRDGIPRYFWWIAGFTIISSMGAFLMREDEAWAIPLFSISLGIGMIFVPVETFRIVVGAIRKKQEGARLVGMGFLLFAAAVLSIAGFDLVGVEISSLLPFASAMTPFFIGVLFLVISMSVHLARQFGHTSSNLEIQLDQVQELSERNLEQERTLRSRMEQELEQARQLQLSMLPNDKPSTPHLDISWFMETATEVGGDYYDYSLADDGSITVTLGDATGHGMQAGTVVTATKSLFQNLADQPAITETFSAMSRSLKGMNFPRLGMAMTMCKITDHKLQISSAGIPPALLYRAESKEIEEIEIGGMPLGYSTSFQYEQREYDLNPGDTLVLMSDGLPERLNSADEELGYPKTQELFAEVAEQSPDEICQHLARGGDEWARGRPQDDDVTFVVLKVK